MKIVLAVSRIKKNKMLNLDSEYFLQCAHATHGRREGVGKNGEGKGFLGTGGNKCNWLGGNWGNVPGSGTLMLYFQK